METGRPLDTQPRRAAIARIRAWLWKPGHRLPAIVLAADLLVFLLTLLARHHPALVERLYATGLYPPLATLLGGLSDLFAFSLQELLIAAAVFVPLGAFLHARIRKRRGGGLRHRLYRLLHRTLLTAGILYALFYPLWGFNYFRTPLIAHACYDAARLTPENFEGLLDVTVRTVNALAGAPVGQAPADWERRQVLLDRAITATGGVRVRAARRLKHFASGVFELFPYSGVTLPFLMEAHLATDLLPWEQAFIGTHERTHLAGYTRESEANFFAWLALHHSPDAGDRYAAALSLLRYLLLHLVDERRPMILASLAPQAQADLLAAALRQAGKSAFLRAAARFVYDGYLRGNAIADGIADYGQMVRLVLGYRLPPAARE